MPKPSTPAVHQQDFVSSPGKPPLLPDAICGTYLVSGFNDYTEESESAADYHQTLVNLSLVVSKVNDSLITIAWPDSVTSQLAALNPIQYYPSAGSSGSYHFSAYSGPVQENIDFPKNHIDSIYFSYNYNHCGDAVFQLTVTGKRIQ